MKKLLLLSLFLFGCEVQTQHQEVQGLFYYKDLRTNLCFTVSHVNEYPFGTADVYSNVPCTPEVEKLLESK